MKLKGFASILLLAFALAAGCASTPIRSQSGNIQPIQAVQMAATAAPRGVPGTFELRVQAVGTQDGSIYLNSELDYRDQRCLTIAITPKAVQQLEAQFGSSLFTYFKGKHVVVTGTAKRAKIGFFSDGKLTNKYYYQTHVEVTDPKQIKLVVGG